MNPPVMDFADAATRSGAREPVRAGATLVLGIGNLLWADEGLGIRALEMLQERYEIPPEVGLLDGGTQGLYLLPFVESCQRLLILDAVDYGLPPGTVHELEDAAVPAFVGAKKMSLHQTGFQEVLGAAMLKGWMPDQVVLIGVQPQLLEDYGGSLTEVVKQVLPEVVRRVVLRLESWGHPVRARAPGTVGCSSPLQDSDERAPLALAAYESGRPSADSAWRWGDARFVTEGGC